LEGTESNVSTIKERFFTQVRAHPYLHVSFGVGIIASGAMLSEVYIMVLLGKGPPPPVEFLNLSPAGNLWLFASSVFAAWAWLLWVVWVLRRNS